MKIIFPFLLIFSTAHSQPNELHTPENIRMFADYLFSEKDYFRSVLEYERLPANDTIQYKIALAYQVMEKYDIALEKFSIIKPSSEFHEEAQKEYYKTLLQYGRYEDLQRSLVDTDESDYQKFLHLSYLFSSAELPMEQNFLKPFPASEKENLLNFLKNKNDPPYKNPLLSGVMSAIIPGSGKIYTGEVSDGITAFITTALLAFLSFDNFSHKHNFRGWLFAGLGFSFYAGNIYGSAAAAQIYNARVDYEYNENLKGYLQNKNYFLPENDFTK